MAFTDFITRLKKRFRAHGPDESTAKLVIFAGQSNMLGHARAIEGEKPQNDRVWAWTGGCEQGFWRPANLGEAPFNAKPDAPNNAAYHFADHLQRSSGQDVYLIGRPINGSTLMSWSTSDAENMVALLAEVENALAHDVARTAKLAVADYLLWSQGESDDPEATMIRVPKADTLESYQHHFSKLVDVLMSQRWWSPDHSGLIACPMVEEGWLSARNDFYGNPDVWPADLNMTAISSSGLGHIGDRAHFNGEALAEIGRRMFEAS